MSGQSVCAKEIYYSKTLLKQNDLEQIQGNKNGIKNACSIFFLFL